MFYPTTVNIDKELLSFFTTVEIDSVHNDNDTFYFVNEKPTWESYKYEIPSSSVISKDDRISHKRERFDIESEDDVSMISPMFKSFKATGKVKSISRLKLNVILP